MTTATDTLSTSERLAGKYMLFKLGAEEYGIPILTVRELIGLMPVTRIPGAPPFVRGVVNLRGRVFPVLDLRLKLGMTRLEATDQTVIIVIEYDHDDASLAMGLLVDEVVEVANLPPAQIEPPPRFDDEPETDAFTLALGKLDRRVVCLLDIGRVLNATDRQPPPDTSQPQVTP